MDTFESSVVEKMSETSKNYAVLAEEFKSMRRDVERIGKGVDEINKRHEMIRVNCADHMADTKIARDVADEALLEIRQHKSNHLAWYGIILAIVAILNLPIGDLIRKVFK
jgi:t-SNARE complex subunit (syntaxin)